MVVSFRSDSASGVSGAPVAPSPVLVGVRVIAVIEAAKGALVLAVGLGVLSLVHRNVQTAAEHVVRLSHLDPASKYPRIFLDAAAHVTDAHLWLLATAAFIYSLIRGFEAYGLWRGRGWAEWFALGSTSLYLPIEIYELGHRFTMLKLAVFAVNAVIVIYMAYALRHRSGLKPSETVSNAAAFSVGSQ
jgi:uncharacterized membrane protein (DUF2068 family)